MICEKPSVVQSIGKVLGGSKRCDGYLGGRGSPVAAAEGRRHSAAPAEPTGETPNKHFREAKMASELTLALPAVCAFP